MATFIYGHPTRTAIRLLSESLQQLIKRVYIHIYRTSSEMPFKIFISDIYINVRKNCIQSNLVPFNWGNKIKQQTSLFFYLSEYYEPYYVLRTGRCLEYFQSIEANYL